MKIPVFVSCPTDLNPNQENARNAILAELDRFNLEPRALGRSDYPTELPLREVFLLAKHCAGGIVLGFEQFQARKGVWKPGTPKARELKTKETVSVPTPWNHLEAGIMFSLGLPLLVFREESVSGGIFDPGVTDVFIHKMPSAAILAKSQAELSEVFLKWQSKVREFYYR